VAEWTGQKSLNSHEPAQVDQALFGYSDGHRQIATSVRLPSKDQYQLAAATDLAAGVQLNPDDSYLTGLQLGESRRFALIRTWPAPEMPRPGCVWSHVLLIESRALSSHGDLTDFLGMFRRPNTVDPSTYDEPLAIPPPGRRPADPDPDTLFDLISKYYSGEQVLLRPDAAPQERDAAIFAIWSQQWPRLRMLFSFRTAPGGERRRSEMINYDVQVATPGFEAGTEDRSSRPAWPMWVQTAAEDAATSRVTQLRRFLWRYGRDLSNPRAHFRSLVELYLAVQNTDSGLSVDDAVRIFESMPEAGDGEILKRDILGISSASPSLIPALAPGAMLQLLASKSLRTIADVDHIRMRFEVLRPEEVAEVAQFVMRYGEALAPWQNAINAGLVSSATRDSLIGDLPGGVRKLILMSRPELIDSDTVAALSNNDLLELSAHHHEDEAARVFASAIVRRDFGTSSNIQLLRSMPSLVFKAAVDAARNRELNPTWTRVIGENSAVILQTDWPVGVGSTTELAIGITLLSYPRSIGKSLEVWAEALASMQDDVSGEDRIRLQAFILRAALQTKVRATWKLVAAVLPELRPAILHDALPYDVHQMLLKDLPKFKTAAFWDINRRILIALSQLRKSLPDDQALASLNLSGEDASTVIYGAEGEREEEGRSKGLLWWF
jgi:hypothetical protein